MYFSMTTLGALRLVCKIGFFLGAFPYSWNDLSQSPYQTKSKWALARWVIVTSYIMFNAVFMALRLAQASILQSLPYLKLFLNLFSVVTFSAASMIQANSIWKELNYAAFYNRVMWTHRYFEERFSPEDRESKPERSAVGTIVILMYVYSASQVLIATKSIDNPKYLYSFFNLKGVPRWKLIPIGLFETWMSAAAASTMAFSVIMYMQYVNTTQSCLTLLSSLPPIKFTRVYRILQLMNIHFNELFRSTILPIGVLTTQFLFVLSSYATFHLFHALHLGTVFVFASMIEVNILIAAEILNTSSRVTYLSESIIFKAQYSSYRRTFYSYKYIRSCPSVKFSISNLFAVQRSTVFTYFATAINYAVTLLLTVH